LSLQITKWKDGVSAFIYFSEPEMIMFFFFISMLKNSEVFRPVKLIYGVLIRIHTWRTESTAITLFSMLGTYFSNGTQLTQHVNKHVHSNDSFLFFHFSHHINIIFNVPIRFSASSPTLIVFMAQSCLCFDGHFPFCVRIGQRNFIPCPWRKLSKKKLDVIFLNIRSIRDKNLIIQYMV